jgi:four helix bundle protein
MAIIGSYRDLDAWALSMDLVDQVLRNAKGLPPSEFELRSQMKRAAISIPANVAEGWCRKDRRQAYQNHVSIAMGSRGELDTELEICFRNGLLRREDCAELSRTMDRVRPILVRLYESI